MNFEPMMCNEDLPHPFMRTALEGREDWELDAEGRGSWSKISRREGRGGSEGCFLFTSWYSGVCGGSVSTKPAICNGLLINILMG